MHQNHKLNLEDKNQYIRNAIQLMPVAAEYIKKLINESIKFASQFNFKPHPSYTSIKRYVDNLPDTEDIYDFQLGDKEGNPLYIQEPYDSDEFAFEVTEKLQNSGAEFNTMMLMKQY